METFDIHEAGSFYLPSTVEAFDHKQALRALLFCLKECTPLYFRTSAPVAL